VAVYDSARDRMLMFGTGNCLHTTWELSLGGSPAWTELLPVGAPPTGGSCSAIYDPVRDRMLVFGGGGNDTWALTLAGTPAWSLLAPTGTRPAGRQGQTAIYDPVRDRMLVFGGGSGSSLYNDVWALSLAGSPAWSQLAPAGTPPSARASHTAIYDPVRDRMVVFGGYDANDYQEDVWELSLAGSPAWNQLLPVGTPGGRQLHTAIYDPVRDRMVVFGGLHFGDLGDVWELTLGGSMEWNQLWVFGPNSRYGHTAIYDPGRFRMVIFGGRGKVQGIDGTVTFNDTWALTWDGITAVQLSQIRNEVEPGLVRLAWIVAEATSFSAALERRTADTEWEHVADIEPDGSGYLEYEDRAVTAGVRYGYRLAYRDGERLVHSAETWLDVPSNTRFALEALSPNPTRDELRVAFSLPSAEPARLELYDLIGRRVLARDVGFLGPGAHRFNFSEGRRLPAGVYHLRLSQGSRTATQRAVFVR
jgi:hypothetical protein